MAINFDNLPDKQKLDAAEQNIDFSALPDKPRQQDENRIPVSDVVTELGKTFGRATLNQLLSLPSTLVETEARDIQAFPEKALAGIGLGRGAAFARKIADKPLTGISASIADAAKIGKDLAIKAGRKIESFVAGIQGLAPAERIITQRVEGFDKENLLSANNIERALQLTAEGLPSLITALAVSVATKNPLAGAAVLGLTEAGQLGREAEEAGASAFKTANLQAAAVIGNTLLEVIPLNDIVTGSPAGRTFFKKSISNLAKSSTDPAALNLLKKVGGRAVIGFIEEGTQEGIQQVFQNFLAKIGFDDTRNLTEGMLDSIVGGALTGTIAGGGIGSLDSFITKAKKKGATDKDIEQLRGAMGTLIAANESELTQKLSTKKEITEPSIAREAEKSEVSPQIEASTPTPLSDIEKQEIQDIRDQISQTDDKAELNKLLVRSEVLQRLISARGIESPEARKERIATIVDLISQLPKKGKAIRPKKVANVQTTIKSVFRTLDLMATTPAFVADGIDGGQNNRGPVSRVFIDSVNEAEDNKLRFLSPAETGGLEALEQNGLRDAKKLSQVREVDDFGFTVEEIMHFYAARNNPENMAAFLFAGIGESGPIPLTTLNKAINTLTEQEKNAADVFVQLFQGENGDNFNRLDSALRRFTDGKQQLTKVEGNWIPMQREGAGLESFDVEISKEFDTRNKLKQRLVNRQFTLERKKLSSEEQIPIRGGLVTLYFDHISKREQFIHFGSLVKDLRSIMSNKEFRDSVVRNPNLGKETFDELNNYVDRVADPVVLKARNMGTRILKVLRKDAAVFFLGSMIFGGNPKTILKQIPSFVMAGVEIDPKFLAAASVDMTLDFENKTRFVEERAPQIFNNTINVELQELKKINPKEFGRIKKRMQDFSLRNILKVDKLVKSTVWLAGYNQFRTDPNISEAEAVRQATGVVLRSQPAAKAKDLPSLFTNETFGPFIQFANQLNKNYNLITKGIPRRAKLGTSKGAEQAFIGGMAVLLNFFLIWTINNGRFPSDEEDIIDLAKEPLSIVPLIGQGLLSTTRGFDPSLPPALQVFAQLHDLVNKPTIDKKAEALVKLISLQQGIPANFPIRVTKAMVRRFNDETSNFEAAAESLLGQFTVEAGTEEGREKARIKKERKREKFRESIDDAISQLSQLLGL